ncbi:MAG: hypothetical protein EPO09_10310 [Aquabacterium sp.]|uniref:hypothetical protein n=1 Tax=Aquabacterium sp. TaxID=1872578 RepID=UPI001219CF05|nr:hypothetical protein [Aquabacterium sp.]TAK94189.1 MAG: hypothetical protein EPO09_10310 [Aquabacterium sp.]
MKKVWIISGLVAASFALGTVIVMGHDIFSPHDASQAPARPSGLPWQVEALPNGASKVMGLTLGPTGAVGTASTMGDAQQLWGEAMQVAIIAAPGEDGLLEAFVDPASAGFITGKIVITARLDSADLRAMRERAIKSEFMESTTRKYQLTPADLQTALKAPITALSFIPQANLDADTVIARFGQPAERVRSNGHLEHFLYPAKGLDLALDTEGKELLQYVAPAEFDRLRHPLIQAAAASSATASTTSASQP